MPPSTFETWLQQIAHWLHAISIVFPDICHSAQVIIVEGVTFVIFLLGISAIYEGMRRAHAVKVVQPSSNGQELIQQTIDTVEQFKREHPDDAAKLGL